MRFLNLWNRRASRPVDFDQEDRDLVARAAALLDLARPGWRNRVDPDRIVMENPDRCVLGQVFGDYNDGLVAFTGLSAVANGWYGEWHHVRRAFDANFPAHVWCEELARERVSA